MHLTQPQAVNLNPDGLQLKMKNSQTNAMFAQKWSSHAPTVKLMKNKFVLGSVNFKHSCLRMCLCMKCMVYTWLYGVHRLAPRRQQFHVEPAMPEHITLVDIKNIKTRYKKLVTCVESCVSAWEWRTALYKSNHHHQCPQDMKTKSSDTRLSWKSGESRHFCNSTFPPAWSSLCVYLHTIFLIPNLILSFMFKYSHTKMGALTCKLPNKKHQNQNWQQKQRIPYRIFWWGWKCPFK